MLILMLFALQMNIIFAISTSNNPIIKQIYAWERWRTSAWYLPKDLQACTCFSAVTQPAAVMLSCSARDTNADVSKHALHSRAKTSATSLTVNFSKMQFAQCSRSNSGCVWPLFGELLSILGTRWCVSVGSVASEDWTTGWIVYWFSCVFENSRRCWLDGYFGASRIGWRQPPPPPPCWRLFNLHYLLG